MVMWVLLEQGLAKVPGLKGDEAKIRILNDVSGIIKPSRKVVRIILLID